MSEDAPSKDTVPIDEVIPNSSEDGSPPSLPTPPSTTKSPKFSSLAPSFMLMPDFDFEADKDLQLGTILATSSETKIPDPRSPLNEATRIPPPEESTIAIIKRDWHFSGTRPYANIRTDMSTLRAISRRLGFGESKTAKLTIQCDSVTTQSFTPDETYVARSLEDEYVQAYLHKFSRPSVYLVTGLMIASNGTVGWEERSTYGIRADLSIDGTAAGVPVSIGPKVEYQREKSEGTISTTVTGSFILAYRLLRVRLKVGGKLALEDFNKHALF